LSAGGERRRSRLAGALRHGLDDHALLVIATLEAGDLDLWIQELDGLTFLSYAARHRKLEIAAALLLRGASIHAKCRGGATALMWAAKSGGAEVARLLLRRGARTDDEDEGGLRAYDYVSCREIESLFFSAGRGARSDSRPRRDYALYIER
jgi:ankyrin repeat protein